MRERAVLASDFTAADYPQRHVRPDPTIPVRAVVQPTLPDGSAVHRSQGVVLGRDRQWQTPWRGSGPVESAWGLLEGLEVPRMISFVRRYVAHTQARFDGRMITDYRGCHSWSSALADVRRMQVELLLGLERL